MSDKKNEKDINVIEEELKRLKKRKSDLVNQVKYQNKQAYRKERARRLIETGALVETIFELDGLSIEERKELFEMFKAFVIANKPKKFQKK